MDLDKLKSEIIRFEGIRNTIYRDTLGNLTGGIGHRIEPNDGVWTEGEQIDEVVINSWYCADSQTAIQRTQQILGQSTWNEIDSFRQRVLVQVVFNLGYNFTQFRQTIQCIHNLDWEKSSQNLMNSEWYNQVGIRGELTCNALINGQY